MDRWWWPTQSWETVSDSNIDTCCLTKRSWVPMHDLVRTLLRGVCILSLCGGSLRALCLPPTVQRHAVSGVRLTGDFKLPAGVNGRLSLCFSPVTAPVSCPPHLLPCGIWDRWLFPWWSRWLGGRWAKVSGWGATSPSMLPALSEDEKPKDWEEQHI